MGNVCDGPFIHDQAANVVITRFSPSLKCHLDDLVPVIGLLG